MFPNGYFAPRYFAPRYFPPTVSGVEIEEPVQVPGGGMAGDYDLYAEYARRKKEALLREDEEIIEIISIIAASGILEE